jgi:hypothetical protein
LPVAVAVALGGTLAVAVLVDTVAAFLVSPLEVAVPLKHP